MAFGCRIFNQLGQLTFDLTDDTISLGAIVVLSAVSGTINYSPGTGRTVFVMFLSGFANWSYSNGVITYSGAQIGSTLYYGSK